MNLTLEELDQLYHNAWKTSQRLPAGSGIGYKSPWVEMIYDEREQQRRAEKIRLRTAPTPLEVEQLMDCINWLQRLTVEQRRLIWLRASGLSWRKISAKTGIPHTTVKRHWHKALLRIQLHCATI
ncbi:DUF6362 family protein [Sansalvadorimonas verongulae]|uniref:DUF6362 family protein n=1 Tax=Sansalvadorimonas verongulae TaxID=2172824 RepID=UPI0012BB973C|nr:DUF6362 family protein [Sansalvadorimonas verongulae]MTI15126.1 sigma-70 family RNA polymerase sigma factor [Sansalvadorimonas verongulae]